MAGGSTLDPIARELADLEDLIRRWDSGSGHGWGRHGADRFATWRTFTTQSNSDRASGEFRPREARKSRFVERGREVSLDVAERGIFIMDTSAKPQATVEMFSFASRTLFQNARGHRPALVQQPAHAPSRTAAFCELRRAVDFSWRERPATCCELSKRGEVEAAAVRREDRGLDETYTVAFQANNQAFAADAVVPERGQRARVPERKIAEDAALADTLHVIPSYEKAAA